MDEPGDYTNKRCTRQIYKRVNIATSAAASQSLVAAYGPTEKLARNSSNTISACNCERRKKQHSSVNLQTKFKLFSLSCALLLTNTRVSPVLLAESSILSNTLHHLTLKYEQQHAEYNIGEDQMVIAYGRNSRDSKQKSTAGQRRCVGMPYSEMEKQLDIRNKMIYSVLKKYKSLVNKLTKTEPYKTFYTHVQPDWKSNLDQVRNVLRKSVKQRCISSDMLDQLEEAIGNFNRLSNGRAFAGFEYPMNGLIAPVAPLIEERFKNTIYTDAIKRGQFMFYMNMGDSQSTSSIRRSPFVAYNSKLLETIKQMRNIVKQYQVYESSRAAQENLNAARAYADKPLIRRYRRAVLAKRTSERRGKKGGSRKGRKTRRRNRKSKTGEALPLNKILRSSRKALSGASEYYDKIQGPIIFYIRAAVIEDWEIPNDS